MAPSIPSDRELDYHYKDVRRQKELLRAAFAGMHRDVDGRLAELDRTPAFYFDSITQLRMDTWSRGRVTLDDSMVVKDYSALGSAGYSGVRPPIRRLAAHHATLADSASRWLRGRPCFSGVTVEHEPNSGRVRDITAPPADCNRWGSLELVCRK